MNTSGIVKLAAEHFQARDYRRALELYKLAAMQLGESNFAWNIAYCRNRLGREEVGLRSLSEAKFFNGYFDKIYLVNLKSSVSRRLSVSLHLNEHNIKYELFDAVNGYEGEPYARYERYLARPLGELKRFPAFGAREIERKKPFIESAGAIGYIYTYLRILNDAKTNKYKRILILEDDVILHNNFLRRFGEFVGSIGEGWKILQLGASQYNWRSVIESDALKNGYYFPLRLDTCGSFAIAFDCSVFDEVIAAESAFESPFDHLALGEVYERHYGKCYVCYPNIVMPDVASSSIRGGRSQHTHSEKMRWRMSDYVYPLPKPTISILITSDKNLRYFDSFARESECPFNLRLYCNTEDGLRPIHNKELLKKPENKLVPLADALCIPECDFAASIDEDSILTELDIINYLESKLLGLKNTSPLAEVSRKCPAVVKSRASIIIPTYSRPANLEKALNSAVQQDYADKEIIVVSDNPPDSKYVDETRSIVCRVQRANPAVSIKLVQHTHNRNGAAARNTGLMNSTGEFICFLDDDDIYLPGRVSSSVSALQNSEPRVGAVYCGFLGWNSPDNDASRYMGGDLTKELLLLEYKKHYLHTNTATYKRSALLAINGFDETYRRHQDVELNLRFFEKYEVQAVKEPGVRLSPEPSNVSNKIFNVEMLNLKQKFLGQFKYLIERLDPVTQRSVYEIHWNEVARYTNDKSALIECLADRVTDGSAQILLKLKHGSAEAKA